MITNRLTPLQLKAIVADEPCHIRRPDNLASELHMGVEALFGFTPGVLAGSATDGGAGRACHEEVLLMGSEPEGYVEGSLKICELYLESPLLSVSGVTGTNLRK